MKQAIKSWWFFEGKDVLTFVGSILAIGTGIVLGIILAAGHLSGINYKYNCNLDTRPSLKTSLLIDSSEYAYNPEGFCAKLKEKMANE